MYIIFFCHTQLTVTLLLCLIFGSKVFMVFKSKGRPNESSLASKSPSSKFVSKPRSDRSQHSTNSSGAFGGPDLRPKYTDQDVHEEFQRVYTQLEVLRERNMRMGNRHLASKITAMQDAARTHDHLAQKPDGERESTVGLAPVVDTTIENSSPVEINKHSVYFAVEEQPNEEKCLRKPQASGEESKNPADEAATSGLSHSPRDGNSRDAKTPVADSNGRYLMSGHARTHSIVINLDDKSRFTDEITV